MKNVRIVVLGELLRDRRWLNNAAEASDRCDLKPPTIEIVWFVCVSLISQCRRSIRAQRKDLLQLPLKMSKVKTGRVARAGRDARQAARKLQKRLARMKQRGTEPFPQESNPPIPMVRMFLNFASPHLPRRFFSRIWSAALLRSAPCSSNTHFNFSRFFWQLSFILRLSAATLRCPCCSIELQKSTF